MQKLALQMVYNLVNSVGCAFLICNPSFTVDSSVETDENELLSNQGTLIFVPIK